MITLLGCIALFKFLSLVEVNTVTPQASSSISSSKKYKFFISDARKIRKGSVEFIDSVWIEKVWRYQIVKGKKHRIPYTSNQIVVRLKKPQSSIIKKGYISEGKISEKHHGNLWSGNGVFMAPYPEIERMDTFQFSLLKMSDSSVQDMGSFLAN